MSAMQRNKGAAGERELAAELRELGFEARRGVQYAGGGGSPDIVADLPGIHIECKRVENKSTGTIYDWLKQAVRDAAGKIPVVMHRRNYKPWVVILPLDEFLKIYRRSLDRE